MIRTQTQLTPEQAAKLRELSSARQLSVDELIRISIDSFLSREAASSRATIVARAKAAAGRYRSGMTDASTNHDTYLADAFNPRLSSSIHPQSPRF